MKRSLEWPEASLHADVLLQDFQDVDTDGDGRINVLEFEKLLEYMGMALPIGQVRSGFRSIDADRDGRISCDEFIAWRALGQRPYLQHQVADAPRQSAERM